MLKKIQSRKSVLWLLLFVPVFYLSSFVSGQKPPNVKVGKGFKLPYIEGTNAVAMFIGETADPAPNGEILLTGFEMKKLNEKNPNEVEMVVQSPRCFLNTTTKIAHSPGYIKVFNATNRFSIEGKGFIWTPTKTNSATRTHLVISNEVHTVIQTATNEPDLHIFADHFEFNSESSTNSQTRIATYTGNVRVEDDDTLLTAELLIADLSASTNALKNIYAERNVVIVSKTNNSRATGDKAVYTTIDGRQVLELTGNPTWKDPQGEGRGDIFTFDRVEKTVLVENNAGMKLPRGAVIQPDFFGDAKTNVVAETNQFIDISARRFVIQLPSPTRKMRKLVAQENVIILSPADKLRATAQQAIFDEATGDLELQTNAVWEADQVLAKGNILTMNRTNHSFRAQENTYLQLPAKSWNTGLDLTHTNSATLTNQFLGIHSGNFEYQTNAAIFRENVRAHFMEGTNLNGSLAAELLDVRFMSNQVVTILAHTNVFLEQLRDAANTNLITKKMQGDYLLVKRSPKTGLLTEIISQGKVEADQLERSHTNTVYQKVKAETMTMKFSATTNQMENFTADKNVFFQKNLQQATGDHAVYRMIGTNESLIITGHPEARTDKFIISEATSLLWNGEKFIAPNGKITPVVSTNVIEKGQSKP